MTKNFWIAAAVIVVVAVVGYAALRQPTEKADITLGAPLLLSGDFTSYGDRVRDAITLAAEDFKVTHPGVSVKVVYEDSHGDPKQALSAYRKLVDINRVDAIVGPMLQAEMGAIEPQIAQDGVPVFSLAPLPLADRAGNGGNPLVLWPDPSREAEQMAQYMYNQGVRSVGVLGTQDAWESEVSAAFRTKFLALGGTVTDSEITLQDSKDDRVTLTKLLATKPEAIFFGTYYKFFDFVTTARQLGFTGKFYSIEIDQSLADQTKGYSDGLQFISPNDYTSSFVAEYTHAYGEAPTIPTGQAYDATALALKLLDENKEDRAAVLAAMASTTSYAGVSGTITLDHYRAIFPLSIFQIQNGQINKVVQ